LTTPPKVEARPFIPPTPDEMLAIGREIALKFSPRKASLADVPPCTRTDAATAVPSKAAVAIERRETKNFGYGELQAISEDIGRRFKPTAFHAEPEILLLPVDPHHLYAYWNSGTGQPRPEHPVPKPLTLRIYWRPDSKPTMAPLELYFDVPADDAAHRKNIRLPIDDTHYAAALGRLNPDYSLEILAYSNLVHVPASPRNKRLPGEISAQENPAPTGAMRFPSREQAASEKGPHFSGSLPLPSSTGRHPGSAQQFAERLRNFDASAADFEPAAGPTSAQPFRHASGRGLK
jgi:hypothetical protein